ncbi:MAG TPA: LPXTG cell wall anchor domain-containing protein [Candidatus Angelobacter sp.]|nr:LPXTG cell wall anchor domain-containing protein [Candidatus Angelobacter sp.]
MITARRLTRLGVALAGTAAVALPLAGTPSLTHAQSAFTVGIPTVVDPVRGVGEPDIVVDNGNNALITGPGGSGTQTSFFWHTRDGGLSYPLLGPSQGHWICPASGGGDSLGVYDRKSGDMYLTDQEALADIGSAKIDGASGAVTTQCASAPGLGADRPFEGILNSTTAPQSVADGGKKPILYLSWACQACVGATGTSPGTNSGLAFGWSDDGTTFHPADPGVMGDNLATNSFEEGGMLSALNFHGNTVADPKTGYVYTAISCAGTKDSVNGPTGGNSTGCPDNAQKVDQNEVGIAIGAPQATPSSSNVGQFSALTYQTAAINDPDGQPMREPGSLFPVIGLDANGTLYEAYIEGDGFATPTNPIADDTAWHLYYTYSTDGPLHQHWSTPVRVDHGPKTQTSDFGWMTVGDPGKLGFVWLGTDQREHPSAQDASNPREWHPFMAITTNALDAHPTFEQQQVGTGPNHINDMCLQGTVGCIQNVGNRNMADFISADIGPDGALQAVWANDSNRLATNPTTLIPGLPLTETARQVSGPRLIGSGDVSDSRFSTAPVAGITDAPGDALYPVDPTQGAQQNQPQLDLTGSRLEWDGTNITVHVDASDLSKISSPSSSQGNVWYLTTWQFNHTIYFARAESDAGGALKFAAGPAKSFDRPGLNAQTVATLVDYSGGTAVQGTQSGNDIAITVPASAVGNPSKGSLLEVVTAFSMLDNGQPLYVAPGVAPAGGGNIPTITDATPAYDHLLGDSGALGGGGNAGGGSAQPPGSGVAPLAIPNTSAVVTSAPVAAGLAMLALGGGLWWGRRRRNAS